MSAVAGVFTAFTTVNSRSVARIVIEVPIEQADAALAALGGFPKPAESRWVGIAPLVAEPAVVAPQAAPEPAPEPQAEKVTRIDGRRVGPWKTLSRAQQAGILCADSSFRRWLDARLGPLPEGEDGAAEAVRYTCGIGSRSDLDRDIASFDQARRTWDGLVRDFRHAASDADLEARYAQRR